MKTYLKLVSIGVAAALVFIIFFVGVINIGVWLDFNLSAEAKTVAKAIILAVCLSPFFAVPGMLIQFIWETRNSACPASPAPKEEVEDVKTPN